MTLARSGSGAGLASFSVGGDALLLVAGGLGPGLADEHVDLGELAVERGDVVAQPCATSCAADARRVRRLAMA